MKTAKNMKVFATVCLFCALRQMALAQGAAFTYQGRLNDGGAPANGSYDLRFAVFDAASAGTQQGGFITNSATAVSNGLFTVTLDFGNQFPGAARWLEIGVRTNNAVSFFTLSPRQALTPAPYAITAGNVVGGGLAAGTYSNTVTFSNSSNSFSGTFSGNGAALSNVNASTLGGLSSSSFWTTTGNAGTTAANFLGTGDNQPLELRVNGMRALRLEPLPNDPLRSDIVNVIGGSDVNGVDVGIYGATIAGGGAAKYGVGTGILGNFVEANFGTIGGGAANEILTGGDESVIAGGINNMIEANAAFSVIGGGTANTIQPDAQVSTIGGGEFNTNSGFFATIPGGDRNVAGGSSLAAGHRAKATHTGSFVWADSTDTDFADTANNQFLIRASGGVGIGTTSPAFPLTVGAPDTPLTTVAQIGAFNNGNAFVVARQTAANVELQMGVDSLEGVVSVVSDHPLVFRAGNGAGTGNHEYMRINTNGFVGIGTSNPTNKLDVSGNISCSSNVFAHGVLLTSDRNSKANFATLDPETILKKVATLPLLQWNYKGDQEGIKHIGPMAQDFHAAFGLNGGDDKHISVVDESGVALAAIQGLNNKVDARNAEDQIHIQNLEEENAQLKRRLDALEQFIHNEAHQELNPKPSNP